MKHQVPHQESVLHSVIIMLQELALPEVTLEYLNILVRTPWYDHIKLHLTETQQQWLN